MEVAPRVGAFLSDFVSLFWRPFEQLERTQFQTEAGVLQAKVKGSQLDLLQQKISGNPIALCLSRWRIILTRDVPSLS